MADELTGLRAGMVVAGGAGDNMAAAIGTGVADTMIDMIVCTLGSLILLFPMYLYYRRGKTSFFMGIVETFVRMNFSPEASVDAPCGIEAPSSVGADSAKAAGFAPRESGESSPQQ